MADAGAAHHVGFVVAETTGGIGRHVRSVAEMLAAGGRRVTVAGPPHVLDRLGFAAVADVRPAHVGSGPHTLSALRVVRRLFRECDVVHAHGLRAGAHSALARGRSRVPLLQTWHNAPPTGGASGGLAEVLMRGSVRAAAVTVAVSPDLEALARHAGGRDVRLLPVAAPVGSPPGRSAADVRAELGAVGRPLVVTVARLSVQKGLDVLADAIDLLPADPAGPVFVVAGTGPERTRLTGRGMRLLGHRDDVADLIAAADLVVMPSRWEGWPLAAQEALRAGRPLVATPVGGLPLLAGDAAAWVPAGDARALADEIRRLLADDGACARLSVAGVARAATFPTEASTAAALAAIYDEVVDDA